jgi:hypothetical protein
MLTRRWHGGVVDRIDSTVAREDVALDAAIAALQLRPPEAVIPVRFDEVIPERTGLAGPHGREAVVMVDQNAAARQRGIEALGGSVLDDEVLVAVGREPGSIL